MAASTFPARSSRSAFRMVSLRLNDGKDFSQWYQTALAVGTTGGVHRSSRSVQQRPDDPRSRSLYADRNHTADPGSAARASDDPASPSRRSKRLQSPRSVGRRAGPRVAPSADRERETHPRARCREEAPARESPAAWPAAMPDEY